MRRGMYAAVLLWGFACSEPAVQSAIDDGPQTVAAVTGEVRRMSTHCPPRLGLYQKMVNEYALAADAFLSGDTVPLDRFGSRARGLSKMTQTLRANTLTAYCRGFFNPLAKKYLETVSRLKSVGLQRVTTVASPQLNPSQQAAVDVAMKDVGAIKEAGAVLLRMKCVQGCARQMDPVQKKRCLSECP
ncbi:MAG: hypothetical protein VX589_13545 [Myxococcota bacterium]|nr:hypothetical protein [Myxococcota bacterium]